jgi:hypothetical protein
MGDEEGWEPSRTPSRVLPIALGLLAVVVLARLVGTGDDTALPVETAIPTPTPAVSPTPTPSTSPIGLPTPSLVSAPCDSGSSEEPPPTEDSSWSLLPPPPLPLAEGGVLLAADDRVYVINDGPDRSFLRMAVIGRDDGDRWACTPDAPVQTRAGATVVWTGSEVIVHGGASSLGPLLDGAAYEPVQRQWRPLPPSVVPTSATPAVRAWTGDELILWGSTGRDGPGGPHGVAYSPARDTWRSLRPAPHAMNMTASAWTGRELLVVGAALDTQNSPVSGMSAMAYDPASDEWRMLADPPDLLPQALTGAWDGHRLVVWDYGLTAAAYDPRTDEWASLEDLPMESAECYPQAVALPEGMVFASYCGQYAVLSEAGWQELPAPQSDTSFGTSPHGIGVVGTDVFLLGRRAVLRYTATASGESAEATVPGWTVLAADVATTAGVRRLARDDSELAEAWAAPQHSPTVPRSLPAVRSLSCRSPRARAVHRLTCWGWR